MPTVQEIDGLLGENEKQINDAKTQLQTLKDKRNDLKQLRAQAQSETGKAQTPAEG